MNKHERGAVKASLFFVVTPLFECGVRIKANGRRWAQWHEKKPQRRKQRLQR